MKQTLIQITRDNLADHPGTICFINPKHPHYHHKVNWLQNRFDEGLSIKLLYLEAEKKPVGFIETVPGEQCWRAVNAPGWQFIHCLWTNGKKYQNQGLGRALLDEAEKEAAGTLGVAVVTSDKAFMANRSLFIKNGYEIAETSGKEQLLIKPLQAGPKPSFNDWQTTLQQYTGLNMVYSCQCPWVARFIEEVNPILKQNDLSPCIQEITTAAQAQKGPSVYGIFNLILDGKLLADRYISTTRFLNIVKKEIA